MSHIEVRCITDTGYEHLVSSYKDGILSMDDPELLVEKFTSEDQRLISWMFTELVLEILTKNTWRSIAEGPSTLTYDQLLKRKQSTLECLASIEENIKKCLNTEE